MVSIVFWTQQSCFDLRRVSIPCCPYSISNKLVGKPAFVPVTRCCPLLHACARSLGNYCKYIVERIYFSSQVTAWGIQRKVLRVSPIGDMCVRTVSSEIDRIFVIVVREAFGSSSTLTESPHQFRVDKVFREVHCHRCPAVRSTCKRATCYLN
jgi:hypothetical protein